MNTRQILKYAEDNGFDSVMFAVKNKDGKHICAGKFLDAYYEIVTIPVLGDGFVRIGDLESQLGYDVQFEPTDSKTYYGGVFCDFVLRGKEVPQIYKDEFEKLSE